jgi:hypothetical protein
MVVLEAPNLQHFPTQAAISGRGPEGVDSLLEDSTMSSQHIPGVFWSLERKGMRKRYHFVQTTPWKVEVLGSVFFCPRDPSLIRIAGLK